MGQSWPDRLWIVRHGESAGNVARDAADLGGLAEIDIAGRDVDVPLSPLGERQSDALGRWFGAMPEAERPEVVLVSPYIRARRTAELIHARGDFAVNVPEFVVDERLREKEFGILDRLTRRGIEQRHPQEAEFRFRLGKFYHRPPGGESWCDVILRLRSALDTLALHYSGRRVLIVGHQVVVLCLRYLLEKYDRGAGSGHRQGGRRRQLLGDGIRLRPRTRETGRDGFAAIQLRGAARGGGRGRDVRAGCRDLCR
jgi:broad specificity phosphatase PhoE